MSAAKLLSEISILAAGKLFTAQSLLVFDGTVVVSVCNRPSRSGNNSLELIELSSINKVSLVQFPPVVTLDQYEMILSGPLGRTV